MILTEVPPSHHSNNYRSDLTGGGTHQTDPVVRWLRGEGGDVAEHVVNLGTVITAVESVTAIVTYCAPLALLPLLLGGALHHRSLQLHLPA